MVPSADDEDCQGQGRPPLTTIHPSKRSDFDTFGYGSNPTVFGRILRGELETRFLADTEELIAFEDIAPRAPLHALVIPKRRIPSVFELDTGADSLQLATDMSEVARSLVKRHHPDAFATGDYLLCFHVPPFYSVDHLHLHVLAPASSMSALFRDAKYNTGRRDQRFFVRWCISLQDVLANLGKGSSPTPYRRDDAWAKIFSDTLTSVRGILAGSSSQQK